MDEDARERVKRLVADAEQLFAIARSDADRIRREATAEAKRVVGELVAQAEELRAAAERELADARRQAEALQRTARVDADRLVDDARRRQGESIAQARATLESGPRPAGGDDPERLLSEASIKVDRMLRVARAEAQARSQEILDEAERRAAQVDAALREKVQAALEQEKRVMRSIQNEELDAKLRLAELREKIEAHERRLAELDGMPADSPAVRGLRELGGDA